MRVGTVDAIAGAHNIMARVSRKIEIYESIKISSNKNIANMDKSISYLK